MGPELISDQFTYNYRAAKVNCDGLTQDDSLVALSGGNCLNWVVGHVVATRNGVLKLLGLEPIWSKERADLYSRGSQPITAQTAVPLDEIMADYRGSQKTLLTAFGKLSDDDLTAPSSAHFFKGEEETLGSALAAFAFHEAYHVGQTGLLRRAAGKGGAIA